MIRDQQSPKPGDLRIVALIDGLEFTTAVPCRLVDGIMDAFERRHALAKGDRDNRDIQMRMRMAIAERLQAPGADAIFAGTLAPGCLWLAMRHWSNAADMSAGLSGQMDETGQAVLTVAVGGSPSSLPGTAWSFMIGDAVHDGRARMAELGPDRVVVVRKDDRA